MSNATPVTEPGMFALVLHSHLRARQPRQMASRRGMDLPVLGCVVHSARRRATTPGRRGPIAPADAGNHARTRGPVGRSPLPRRDASLARQLADPRPRGCRHAGRGAPRTRRARTPGVSCRSRRFRDSLAARRLTGVPRPHRSRGLRASRRAAGPPVPTAARSSIAGVLPPRRSRRRACPVESHSDRDLGTRVRVHPGHGARVRRSGRHPLHGRRPRLARRHVPRPPGSRIRRGCIRPRPAGQLPRLVPQVRISGSRRLPRLPHLRPRDGSQAVAGHRTDRRLRRQVAVRPRTRCGRRRQACCRLRRNRSGASAQ